MLVAGKPAAVTNVVIRPWIRFGTAASDFGTISENLFTFDGVVLEIFGLTQTASGAHQRFHRDLMTITIEEPDRKGARKVAIYAGARGVGQCMFMIAEQDRPVIDFLERVRAPLPAA